MKHSSQPGTFARFVSYYKGQGGLFWADMACALIVAGIDLAFPDSTHAEFGSVRERCGRNPFGTGNFVGVFGRHVPGSLRMPLLCGGLGPHHGRSHGDAHASGPVRRLRALFICVV